jgi:hypothetical protein
MTTSVYPSIIEEKFHEFLESSAREDKDIEYCLLQSTVEPIIRFKFGSWLNKKYPERITLNLMEANRLDLVVGFDDKVYFIEFGHLLNLLQHGAYYNNIKVKSDGEKLESKAEKLISKIKKIESNYFRGKENVLVVCSLFSDIKLLKKEQKFETLVNAGSLFSGTLFKYGDFPKKITNGYFENYSSFINKEYNVLEELYPTGYKEVPIIYEKLSLHYKFKYPMSNL